MNPWATIEDRPPYVLDADAPLITAFNSSRYGAEPYRIHLDVPPTPFTGSLAAPVVLLNLNPGYTDLHTTEFADQAYRASVLANLRQDPLPHTFMLLDPVWEYRKAGHRWWSIKARSLVEVAGLDDVTSKLLVVEWFPYHSRKFRDLPQPLPSQEFGFAVVRAAIKRHALIVAMRSAKRWKAAVPALASYGNYSELRNGRNPAISPRNCAEGVFNRIIRALDH
jgi:hypothetical protein